MKQLIFLLLIIFPFCISAQSAGLNNGSLNNGDCFEIDWKKDIILDSCRTAPFKIIAMNIEEDCLIIKVQYGGGCGDTNFKLLFDGVVTESLWPSLQLFLAMDDQDSCRALLVKELKFDLHCFKGFVTENGLNISIINHDKSINYQP